MFDVFTCGTVYICLLAGAFTNLPAGEFPLPVSQATRSITRKQSIIGSNLEVKFLLIKIGSWATTRARPAYYATTIRLLRLPNAAARMATCKNASMLVSARAAGHAISSSPAAWTICKVWPWSGGICASSDKTDDGEQCTRIICHSQI